MTDELDVLRKRNALQSRRIKDQLEINDDLRAENASLRERNTRIERAFRAIDVRLRAELRSYKENPTKALQEIGYHDVEQFYKDDANA